MVISPHKLLPVPFGFTSSPSLSARDDGIFRVRVRKVTAGTHVGNGGLDQCGSMGCWKDAGVGGHCPLGFQTLVLYSVCLVF